MRAAFVAAGLLAERQVVAADPHQGAIDEFLRALPGASIVRSNKEVVAGSEIIVLAVKPQTAPTALSEMRGRDVGRQARDFDHHGHPIRCAWQAPAPAGFFASFPIRRASSGKVPPHIV